MRRRQIRRGHLLLKIVPSRQDVQAVTDALLSLKIGDSTDTIYGGETVQVLVYKGDMLLYDLHFKEKNAF